MGRGWWTTEEWKTESRLRGEFLNVVLDLLPLKC